MSSANIPNQHHIGANADNNRGLIEVSKLIDLTEAPVGLTEDQIGWSRVKSTSSNCICCCVDNSITLVTTDNSYSLNHVPLDNILSAQVNPGLQHLALSNHRKLVVVELVDVGSDLKPDESQPRGEVRHVNLAGHGLTMGDVIFWRWLDDTSLAILSFETLYVCSISQPKISHPAFTAFLGRSRQLSMQKVFDVHRHLTALCQVNDIKRDPSGDLFAISSLYTASSLIGARPAPSASGLRSNFGSVPSRLSQMVSFDKSFDSIRSEQMLFEPNRPSSTLLSPDDETYGLVQIYSRSRDQSQLIQSHAVAFVQSSCELTSRPIANGNPFPVSPSSSPSSTSSSSSSSSSSASPASVSPTPSSQSEPPTFLVAANKIDNNLRVYFIEMENPNNKPTSGFNAHSSSPFDWRAGSDFPTAIHCSTLASDEGRGLQVAMIITKHGQLYVYSILHATILFSTTITANIISSSVLESKTRGLMVICRNGQVLLVRLDLRKLISLLDASKSLRHISSSQSILSTLNRPQPSGTSIIQKQRPIHPEVAATLNGKPVGQLSASLDAGLEILMSTKL